MTKCGQIPYQWYLRNILYPFDNNPMHIIANLAVRDNPTATFPSKMEIEYIRVYQKINSSITVNICSDQDILGSTIAGENIIVCGSNCSITLNSGEILDLVANESIVLDSGFEVEAGALFTAKTTGL